MEHDRGRLERGDFRTKKYTTRDRDDRKQFKRPITLLKSKDYTSKPDEVVLTVPQTILLKKGDFGKRPVSPQSPFRPGKDPEPTPVYHLAPRVPPSELYSLFSGPPDMQECIKFISPETLAVSNALFDFLMDSNDFIVIGCLGFQGVGKSTIMSQLANPKKKAVFQIHNNSDNGSTETEGIDVIVTEDRLILLDVEPMQPVYHHSRGSEEEMENDLEILSLQYAALLLSVCHIVLVMENEIFSPDILRYLLAAERLKPNSSVHIDEQTSSDYFPYVVFLHNKTQALFFYSQELKILQDNYKKMFQSSQIPISSGIGLATGNILKSLTPELCGEPINLFGLPNFDLKGTPSMYGLDEHTFLKDVGAGFNLNIKYDDLMKKIRLQLLRLPPMSLTGDTEKLFTEKHWLQYTRKMWEDIKKSTLFPKYRRSQPIQASIKADLSTLGLDTLHINKLDAKFNLPRD